MSNILYIIGGLIAVLLFFIIIGLIIRSWWYVAEPNEALLISGIQDRTGGYHVVTKRGVLVKPFIQRVRRISLKIREAQLGVSCHTHQGVPITVNGVCVYKIGDTPEAIVNAATRFLGQDDVAFDKNIHTLFEGHTRGLIGGMTFEEIVRDSEKLSSAVRNSISLEVGKLGLVIDFLQIKDVVDPTNYIQKMALPHIAEVEQLARVAKAEHDQIATLAEQEAAATIGAAKRDSQIKLAAMQAEIDAQRAKSQQAGPLAEAQAQQEVLVQQTEIQRLEAIKKEQQLSVDIKKPAEARAYAVATEADGARKAAIFAAEGAARRTELEAEARAKATRLNGDADADAKLAVGTAEAEATKAKLLAEADGLRARGEALAKNQQAVISQNVVQLLPEIVKAAAAPFGNIQNFNVLDGADGVNKSLSGIIASAVGLLPVIQQGLQELKDMKQA